MGNVYGADGEENSFVLISADGVNWLVRQGPLPWAGTGTYLYGIAYGNRQFVAVGGVADRSQFGFHFQSTILMSPDGENWNNIDVGPGIRFSGITYGNGQFVAVRLWNPITPLAGTVLTSGDGVGWVERQTGTEISLSGIAYGAGQFVVCGSGREGGVILSSVDGTVWVPRQSETNSALYAIAYANGRFVTVGSGGAILQSDSVLGSIITLALRPNAGTRLVSLSLEGPAGFDYTIQTSTNLISWRDVTKITNSQSTNVIMDGLPAAADHLFYRAYSQ